MPQSINSTLPAGHGHGILTSSQFDNEVIAVSSFKGTSAAIGGTVLTAGTHAIGNVAIIGIDTTMSVTCSPVAFPGNVVWNSYVVAPGIAQVVITNATSGNVTPTSTTYVVRCFP